MWFTENPWPPIFVCVGLAGLCVAAWVSTRRAVALAGAAGLVGLCVAIFVAERLIVSDAERVEAAVVDLAAAYERRDLDRALAFISDDAAALKSSARWLMDTYEVRGGLRITDLDARLNENGTEAVSHFRANGSFASRRGTFGPTHYATRWEFTWHREPSGWKVVAVQPLHVVSGERDERLERYLGGRE
ncbi:MAG TPA: hypothetical protein VML55_17960 [Planctomycetaceae bacterium]|nr:hypothetical protein [Planctomycetaceae bacterium]